MLIYFIFEKQPSGGNVWQEPIGDYGHVPEKGLILSIKFVNKYSEIFEIHSTMNDTNIFNIIDLNIEFV